MNENCGYACPDCGGKIKEETHGCDCRYCYQTEAKDFWCLECDQGWRQDDLKDIAKAKKDRSEGQVAS